MSLAAIVERLVGIHVLVLGDPIEDVYHFGHVDRLSPEAPVPVFVMDTMETRMGGAANVNKQLLELGLHTTPHFPVRSRWSVKNRFMVGHHQLFRWDQDYHLHDDEVEHFDLTGVKAVVISDYAKGSCGMLRVQGLLEQAAELGIPSVVDPKGLCWDHYHRASVITPNLAEWRAMRAACLPTRAWFPKVVRKRGAEGLEIWDAHGSERLPAQAQQVFDVTGAGDTVTAVIAAALAAGADLVSAAQLANLAAGHVVGKVGTTVCPIQELTRLAQEYDDAHRLC